MVECCDRKFEFIGKLKEVNYREEKLVDRATHSNQGIEIDSFVAMSIYLTTRLERFGAVTEI